MANRKIQVLSNFTGVAPGQWATLDVPLGRTYHSFALTITRTVGLSTFGAYIAAFGDLRVKINGRTEIEIAMSDLYQRNIMFGLNEVDGVCVLPLDLFWLRDRITQEVGCYGTGGISSMQLEVFVKDTEFPVTSIAVHAETSANRVFGSHLVIRRFNDDFAGAGRFQITDIPRGAAVLTGLRFLTSNFDQITVESDGNAISESTVKTRAQSLGRDGRVVPAGQTFIDFTPHNIFEDVAGLAVNSFVAKIEALGAANFQYYLETVEPGLAA
ncbi:MAG: major capsid protein P2 [Pseudomonadota bacterium]